LQPLLPRETFGWLMPDFLMVVAGVVINPATQAFRWVLVLG
jgi:hypothetical protein